MGSTRWSQINALLNLVILALLLVALHHGAASRDALAGLVHRMEQIEQRLNKHVAKHSTPREDLQTAGSQE